jgi:hypothetical protein
MAFHLKTTMKSAKVELVKGTNNVVDSRASIFVNVLEHGQQHDRFVGA